MHVIIIGLKHEEVKHSAFIFIFPLFFCFPKRKAPKEKGTGKNAASRTCRGAPAFAWGHRAANPCAAGFGLIRAGLFYGLWQGTFCKSQTALGFRKSVRTNFQVRNSDADTIAPLLFPAAYVGTVLHLNICP